MQSTLSPRGTPAVFVLFALLACACGSATPTSPSVTITPPAPAPAPAPAPSAPLPIGVGADNVIYLPPPARPPNSATQPIVGRYSLEIASRSTSGLRCQTVPEHAKRRIYTADIDRFRDYYAVRLYDATFLKDGRSVGYGCSDSRLDMGGVCHQFIMRLDGNETVTIEMAPEDEWRGAEIWEVLSEEGRLLQVHGSATGTARDGRILATGSGGVWYGNGLPASDYAACDQGEMSWTFRRQ